MRRNFSKWAIYLTAQYIRISTVIGSKVHLVVTAVFSNTWLYKNNKKGLRKDPNLN